MRFASFVRTRIVFPLAIIFGVGVLSACNTRDAVATGLLGLQNAAIAANATIDQSTGQPALSDADAVHIVKYTGQALVTLETTPSGWQATVKSGWTQFESDLPATQKTKFAVLIAAIDSAVNAL